MRNRILAWLRSVLDPEFEESFDVDDYASWHMRAGDRA